MSIRPSTKNKRALDKAAEWLKQHGVEEDAIVAAKETNVQTKEEIGLEAEAVLAFLEKPTRFVIYVCKRCGDSFGTNYRYNRYCSDTCRSKSLRDMGIEWDQHADAKSRWGGEPPLTIPVGAIESLMAAAARISESGLTQESQNQSSTYSDPLSESDLEASTKLSDTNSPSRPRESPETRTSGVHTSLDFSIPELSGF